VPVARALVKYVAGALRKHHERILETLQLLYKALEARDAEALYKLVKFAQGFVDACHHSVEELISRGCARRVPI
jgi:hemerythrin-like domain-containing protein